MLAEFQGWRKVPTSPMSEAVAAVRGSLGTPQGAAMLLGYTPVARVNPYQALLYKRFGQVDVAVAPIPDPHAFVEYRHFTDLAPTVGVHFHWPAFVLRDCRTRADARTRVAAFVDGLDALRDSGVKVIFTVHNLIPHDATFVDDEVELQQALADRSDVVHTMSKSTIEAVEGFLRIEPDRVVTSPHPNYRSAYPDYVTKQTARQTLGIDADDVVYVVFGALKRYKGLSRLVDAIESANRMSDRRRRLVIAGAPDDSSEVRRFVNAATVHPDVLIAPSRVPADHVQYYMRSADIGLVPYERVLNSGAALLYQSFDLPVIAAHSPALWENLNAAVAEEDHGGGATELAAALVRSDRLLGEDLGSAVRDHVRQYDPDVLSRAFALELRERLGQSGLP